MKQVVVRESGRQAFLGGMDHESGDFSRIFRGGVRNGVQSIVERVWKGRGVQVR